MILKLLAALLVALAIVPAGALASNSSRDAHGSAAIECAALRAKIGPISFEQAFASTESCVSVLIPLARQSAVACRSEQANADFAATHGGKSFARFYGNARNAYVRCVSAKDRSVAAAEAPAVAACQAEEADASFASSHGGATFAQFYGGNALASCVALGIHPAVEPSPAPPTQPAPAPEPITPNTGCRPVETGPGVAQPLLARCPVYAAA